jgi:hypothetical protein
MEVLNVLAAKRNLARRVLTDLVDNYKVLEDDERLEKSNTILDEVNSYLQIEENLFFPYIHKTGEHEDLLARIKAVHERIEEVAEHAIMMHVDEPSGEYYHRLVNLIELLDLAKRADEEILFPWAEAYLKEEEQYYIASHMKNQMIQESLPSSGMTIY